MVIKDWNVHVINELCATMTTVVIKVINYMYWLSSGVQ